MMVKRKNYIRVNVAVGDSTPGKVTSIELDQKEITFIKNRVV